MSDPAWTDFLILLGVGVMSALVLALIWCIRDAVLSVLVLALIWCIRDALKDRRHARRRSHSRPSHPTPARGDKRRAGAIPALRHHIHSPPTQELSCPSHSRI